MMHPAGNSDGQQQVGSDFDHVPLLMKLVFAAAGLAVVLAGSGVIPVPVTRFPAPHWAVVVCGLMFLLAATLMFIGQHRFLHPAIYMFVAAAMCTALAVVLTWVALWSKGPFSSSLAIGGVPLGKSTSDDIPARVLFAAAALLTVFLAGLGWYRWWRALRGRSVDLS